jgi:hypothetical protein
MAERWNIAANVADPRRTHLRRGAKVVVIDPGDGWCNERMKVRGCSVGGRVIETWIKTSGLANFRAALSANGSGWYDTKEAAQAKADEIARNEAARIVGAPAA